MAHTARREAERGGGLGSAPPARDRFLPGLVLLFVGSGAAALIYEIVWFQMLSLIIGSSAVSLGVLLATFMGGMCIGSIGLSYVIAPHQHPLRVYAWLEVAIALFGLLVLLALPWVGGLYAALGGGGPGGLTFRAVLAAACLLPPTILMGATLPAIARWVEATPRGVSWMGFFYGGNIAGAIFGSLLAGFYLLRVHDVAVATFVAASINIVVAAAGLVLARAASHTGSGMEHVEGSDPNPEASVEGGGSTDPAGSPPARLPASAWPVLVVIGLSGMTALGAEVVWARLLSLLMGGSVYTFSLILAAFLFGLGIGSGAGSLLARSIANPRRALGICQLLVMGGLAWAAFSLTRSLPYWPVHPALALSPWHTFQLDLARSLWAVLPGSILWGASFPLALAALASRGQDPGRLVGAVYAANTVGAIVGALGVALFGIGTLGTQGTQRILILIAAAAAIVALGARAEPTSSGSEKPLDRPSRKPLLPAFLTRDRLAWTFVAVGLGGLLTWGVGPVPGHLVAYGRHMPSWLLSAGEIVYVGEGMHASLAVTRTATGALNYHNAGKVQASSEPQDMRLQRMLGHLSTLVPEHPRSVLVIGLGAGVTAGAVSIDPRVERVTVAEIEPLVPKVVSAHFSDHNFAVVSSPKVHIEIDDGRHYLLTTDETFDAITSDPLDPWVKGAANLYTREFFELVRSRLNPGGVATVFVQLYEAGMEAVKSEIATFVAVFPHATVWANTLDGRGYDLVLMGQVEPTTIDLEAWEERLGRPEYAAIRRSLLEIGFPSAEAFLATYAGSGSDLRPWIEDAQINRDRNLRLQYLAGLGLNRYEQDLIYREMLSLRTFPRALFVGPGDRVEALGRAIMGGSG